MALTPPGESVVRRSDKLLGRSAVVKQVRPAMDAGRGAVLAPGGRMMRIKRCNFRRSFRVSSLLVLANAMAQAAPALAQPTDEPAAAVAVSDAAAAAPVTQDRVTRYDAAYFTAFAPSNALDMVRRVPGFSIEDGGGDVRGFSQAAGNVVFNGSRPSSKSESLGEILTRIPASRVVRIEVGPGDLYGSDYAGKSQVLNLILSDSGGVDGNIKVSAGRVFTGWVVPNAEASVLIKTGSSTINLSAGTGRGGQVEEGFDDLTLLSDGSRIELREKVNRIEPRNPFFAASWGNKGANGRAANINLRYSPGSFSLIQTNRVTPANGPVRDDNLVQDYHPTSYEIGGDIARPLGGGTIKLVALGNRRENDNFDGSYNRVAGNIIGGFEASQASRYDEVLGRLSWSKPKLLGFSAEFGSEVAYNRLENATEVYVLGLGGVRTRLDLPIDSAVVDELRSESYVNLGRQLTKRLRLETRLAFETSDLTVSGDTQAKRNLKYFKPSVTLDWKGPKGWHVQLVGRRTVAQLDFFDFIASAELANDRINGGNADIVPQRTWELRLTIDRPILGKGVVRLEVGHDRVSMLQDRILTPEGFDAPGNIGSGTRSFAAITVDAPLDSLGLKATRLKFSGAMQEHSVRDPITGLSRPWSGFRPSWSWNAELRRDLKQWSYGAEIFREGTSTIYRIDELDSFSNSGPFVLAFVEFRPDKQTTLRLDVENVVDSAGLRRRLFFDPNRSAAAPVVEEFRRRDAHPAFVVSINRKF
jgi:hypothetical protein